ncbi:MAG: glycosyltransferase family 2 protein [Eubacterium sp.]|nr:glycosyltransferase family 2 protein [Eubacterium sp.]
MKVSIVIPCYNEQENIPLILERFKDVIHGEDMEIILVDNGSTDDSAKVLSELLPQYSFARTVKVPVNQGYGYGILSGLKEAKGEFLGWTHADMQTDPQDVIKAYHLLDENKWEKNIMVKGNRKGRGLFDNIFTFGMAVFETVYLHKSLYDINAQPNIFSKEFFASWENPPKDFSLDLYALYMAKVQGIDVIRFSVLFPPRIHGQSHWNTGLAAKYKFIKRTIDFSVKLKKGGIS